MYNMQPPYSSHHSCSPIYNFYFNTTNPHHKQHYLEDHVYNSINMNQDLTDFGPEPFVVNIDQATKLNPNYRTALWTGEYLQLTLMSINIGDDIGLEIHNDHDQFIRIESGEGLVKMGDTKDNLDFQERVFEDYAIFIPARKWHNLVNTGYKPLKLYSIYAPPEHPKGVVHLTKPVENTYTY